MLERSCGSNRIERLLCGSRGCSRFCPAVPNAPHNWSQLAALVSPCRCHIVYSAEYNHDFAACFYSHPGEKAKRRCLLEHMYGGKLCPDTKQNGECPRGDACHMTHSVSRYMYASVSCRCSYYGSCSTSGNDLLVPSQAVGPLLVPCCPVYGPLVLTHSDLCNVYIGLRLPCLSVLLSHASADQ